MGRSRRRQVEIYNEGDKSRQHQRSSCLLVLPPTPPPPPLHGFKKKERESGGLGERDNWHFRFKNKNNRVLLESSQATALLKSTQPSLPVTILVVLSPVRFKNLHLSSLSRVVSTLRIQFIPVQVDGK